MTNFIIDRYEIIEKLGSGGFGQTFLAKDTRMPSHRIVVVKKLKPFNQRDIDYQIIKDSFTKEAVALESLQTQSYHIPKLYDHFEYEGDFYLIQEYIEGETLAKISPISQEQVFLILISLLKTLIYIHSRDIIHRDIKPENIIIRKSDGVPFLIDFGAVKDSMGKTQLNSVTVVSSKVIGTKGYMAPEQSVGCSIFSSDLYSLARTMIYALTGKLPVEFEINLLTGEIDWLKYVSEIDPKLASVLNKAGKISPEFRYQTAAEMHEDLHFNSQVKTKVVDRKSQQKSTNEEINSHFSSDSKVKTKPHPKEIPTVIISKFNSQLWKSLFWVGAGLLVSIIFGLLYIHLNTTNKVNELIQEAKDFYIDKKYKDCLELAKNTINQSEQLLVFGQNTLLDDAIDIKNKCQLESDKELLVQAESSKKKKDYMETIKTALKVSNYDNNIYQKTQAIIDDTVNMMLANTKAKYDTSGDSDSANAEIQPLLEIFVPESKFYQEVNSNIEKWKSDEQSNKEKLNQAQSELDKGNWNQAYNIANSITTTAYKKLAQPIKNQAFEGNNKSQLERAKKAYNRGDLKGAIDKAKQIDKDSNVYYETKELLGQWQLELDNLESDIRIFLKHYFEDLNTGYYKGAWSHLTENFQNTQTYSEFVDYWDDMYVYLKVLKFQTKSDFLSLNLTLEYDYPNPDKQDIFKNVDWCLRKDLSSGFKFETYKFCK